MTRIDYDKLAADYAIHRIVHPGVLEGLTSGHEIGAGSRVLEVGCGTGNYIVAVHDVTGASCYGNDPSGEMLKKAAERSDRVRFQQGGAEKLEFDTDFFDLVFSVDVIHHLESPLDYFVQAFRILKKGGGICTVTDSEWIIKNRLISKYWPETVDYELRRYPGVARMRLQMKAAGFINTTEKTVETPFEVTDTSPYRDKAFSVLRIIPSHVFKKGLKRMEADLKQGPISGLSRYLMLRGHKP
jgi:ubiquinone/menaquinone biosynthesis C-methylase UbiE